VVFGLLFRGSSLLFRVLVFGFWFTFSGLLFLVVVSGVLFRGSGRKFGFGDSRAGGSVSSVYWRFGSLGYRV
jgi:hypothetical protein